jgi:Tripartite tricarboxylate transporter TctB family
MKTHDQGSSLFWLLLSVAIFIESLRLGIGTARNPGMGFMSFGASGLLGILSIILFLQTSFKKGTSKVAPLFFGTLWKRVVFVLISLVLYSRLLPVAGFLISTFLLMTLLFWILERKKVWRVFVSSILTTGITYYVFSILLNCQFPSGLLGF